METDFKYISGAFPVGFITKFSKVLFAARDQDLARHQVSGVSGVSG